jgi:hypothetical protein
MSQDFVFEASYWGNCCNTFDEEQKHYVYARCMGLEVDHYRIIPRPKLRILDVGGGPVSMLLKVPDLEAGLVWDPLQYPQWTIDRYASANIAVRQASGEALDETGWDEVWLYNCLQHTEDPERIIHNCLRAAPVFRIFEWVDIPPHEGHPQMLTQQLLDSWISSSFRAFRGNVIEFKNHHGCTGRAYVGVFAQ